MNDKHQTPAYLKPFSSLMHCNDNTNVELTNDLHAAENIRLYCSTNIHRVIQEPRQTHFNCRRKLTESHDRTRTDNTNSNNPIMQSQQSQHIHTHITGKHVLVKLRNSACHILPSFEKACPHLYLCTPRNIYN